MANPFFLKSVGDIVLTDILFYPPVDLLAGIVFGPPIVLCACNKLEEDCNYPDCNPAACAGGCYGPVAIEASFWLPQPIRFEHRFVMLEVIELPLAMACAKFPTLECVNTNGCLASSDGCARKDMQDTSLS